jgi:hypothetical protein
MRSFRRLTVYVGSFAIGRGALFGAPLLLANFLSSAAYGNIEWALAAAAIATPLTVLGTGSLVPVVTLMQGSDATLSGILTHHVAIFTVSAAVLGALLALGGSHALALVALFVIVLSLQQLCSVRLRSRGSTEPSILLDAGLFGAMALAAVLAKWTRAPEPMTWVWWSLVAYGGCLLILTLRDWVAMWRTSTPIAYAATVRSGVPLMLGAFVAMAVTSSGRFGIGLLGGPLVMADYAVLARAAALPIAAHQLLLLARFRDVFLLDPVELERSVAKIVLIVAALAFVLWPLSTWFSWTLGPAFARSYAQHRIPALWILGQSILWSGIALNDLVVARYQVAGRVLRWTSPALVSLGIVGWGLLTRTGVTLAVFAYVHGTIMLVFFVVQAAAMHVAGIRLLRGWSAAVASYVVFIGIATWIG